MSHFLLFCFSASFTFLLSRIPFNFSKHKSSQVQNIHAVDIPRTGGLALLLPLIYVVFSEQFASDLSGYLVPWLFFLALCAFVIGIVDDMFFNLRPRKRLILLGGISALSCALLGGLSHLNIFLVDIILENSLLSVYFVTVTATIGLVNAFNMIDGLDGLSSGVVMLALFTIGRVGAHHGQPDIAEFAFILTAIVSGFWIINVLGGGIFLGDSGAYFLGFMVAQLCIFLNSHVTSVSSWCYLLICIYPFWDMFFSILRRLYNSQGVAIADRKHLHHVVYDYFGSYLGWRQTVAQRASVTVCLAVAAVTCLLAFKFRENDTVLKLICVIFLMALTAIHLWLVRICGRSQHAEKRRISI